MDALPAMPVDLSSVSLSAPSCGDPASMAMLALLSVVGLVLVVAGYRLYVGFLGGFGFVLAFVAQGAWGATWLARHPGAENEKKAVVAVCCVVWGLLGAALCIKANAKLQRALGFLVGAALGLGLVVGLVFAAREEVGARLGPSYQGWDAFATLTLGVPTAVLVGLLARNSIKYLLMLASALGGASVAVQSLVALLACAEVKLGALARPAVEVAVIVGVAALGLAAQLSLERSCAGDGAAGGKADMEV